MDSKSLRPSSAAGGIGLGVTGPLYQKQNVPCFKALIKIPSPWETNSLFQSKEPTSDFFIHGPCDFLEFSPLETVQTSYLAMSRFLNKE